MKTGLAIGVGVLVVGALAYQNMRLSSDVATLQAERGARPGAVPRPGQEDQGLADRVAELEYELKRLRAGRHGGQPPAAEHPAAEGVPVARRDEAPPPPVSARAHEVLEVLESYDPAVRDRLRAVIQEEQEVLRQQESEFRDERRDARTLRQIQELAEKADLTSADTDFLYGALTTERQEIRALFRTARIEGSYGEAHDKANEMRAKTDQAVAEKLNDEQYEAYQAMRDQQRGPWARRRRATKEATKN